MRLHVGMMVWLGIALFSWSSAQWVWSSESGWTNPEYASKSNTKALFESGREKYQAKKYEEAVVIFTRLREEYPASKYSEDILFYQAECFFALNRLSEAHESFYTYFLDYPNSKRLENIVSREYDIGVTFLESENTELLGMKIINAREEGIRVLKTLIKIYPHSEFSDLAQYKIAQYYFLLEDYDTAETEYQELLDKYLLSKWRSSAVFQMAMTYLNRHQGTAYDASWLQKSAQGFRKFLKDYPEDQQVPQAKKLLQETLDQLAQKLYETAEYYERAGAHKAALHYYKLLAIRYPESHFSTEASAILKENGQ